MIQQSTTLTLHRLTQLLERVDRTRVGLLGDLSLDAYWLADMQLSELSRETPHYPLPVVEERLSPGAGGNVAANLAALAPGKLMVVGAIGCDWRGDALLREMQRLDIGCQHLVRSSQLLTHAYCKPLRKGISQLVYEDPRIDFVNTGCCPASVEAQVLDHLEKVSQQVDVLCVCDQFTYGIVTPAVRSRLGELACAGLPVVVDSRSRIGHYTNVLLKPNELEGRRAVDRNGPLPPDPVSEFACCARLLAQRSHSQVCMTMGDLGCLWVDEEQVVHLPAHPLPGTLDICGAGDSFLSSFAVMLAAGATPVEAASVANLASEVTVQKLGITGTATRQELIGCFSAWTQPVDNISKTAFNEMGD